MPPQYVKPYVKTNKNDAADAAGICEAVTRPTMRFVAVKSEDQQAVLMLHRARFEDRQLRRRPHQRHPRRRRLQLPTSHPLAGRAFARLVPDAPPKHPNRSTRLNTAQSRIFTDDKRPDLPAHDGRRRRAPCGLRRLRGRPGLADQNLPRRYEARS